MSQSYKALNNNVYKIKLGQLSKFSSAKPYSDEVYLIPFYNNNKSRDIKNFTNFFIIQA